MIYERLCDDPLETTRGVLGHFGLHMHDQVERFVTQSTRGDVGDRWRRGEQFINRYFSVYRDPTQSRSKWKSELSVDDRRAVFDVVSDSDAFQFCAEQGEWERS